MIKANVSNKNTLPRSFKIYFHNNSNELSINNVEILKRSATSIKNYPNSEIIIKGYTDFYGNYWHNKKVAKIRANLVRNYLVEHGVKAYRIKTIGLGPENPIGSNDNVSGKKMNLWVEIKIILQNQEIIL